MENRSDDCASGALNAYDELTVQQQESPVRWGIRNQILWPFAAVLLAAIALTAFASAYFAAERSERQIADRLATVIKTLEGPQFPYKQNVIEMMRGLSGAEYVVLTEPNSVSASTFADDVEVSQLKEVPITLPEESPELGQRTLVELHGERYFAAGFQRKSPYGRDETLIVLYPERQLQAARREAAMPPLIVGGVTLVALVILSAWLASRFGRRIRRVQEQVARIADGDFRELSQGKTRDEIFELVGSINQMSVKLRDYQAAIARTERSQLLGQLAGGLAHQLRNAVTGARLAIQLHQRRCETESDRESLDVAMRQLSITEEHIKSLLSVGKQESPHAIPGSLGDVIDDVAALVSPVCHHESVSFETRLPENWDAEVSDCESLRTAVLNLALNAVEATGPGGCVEIVVNADGSKANITVRDNGPGPSEELAGNLFEPFATGKPEGVGLGLAVVKQTAASLGGDVQWERVDGWTEFRLQIPVDVRTPATV